jgi:hypothetical protein
MKDKIGMESGKFLESQLFLLLPKKHPDLKTISGRRLDLDGFLIEAGK